MKDILKSLKVFIFFTIIMVGISIALVSCTKGKDKKMRVPPYTVIEEEGVPVTYDTPLKVMEIRRVLVDKGISKEGLRSVLLDMYKKLKEKKIYKNSSQGPTQTMVFVYDSMDIYKENTADWIGSLDWNKNYTEPKVNFSMEYQEK
ncbi:MAG: hypothetical protein COS99_07805 [Candidatus Omnitrophica bacterium CG07_land_8_20_14_0_80_42_15]|uniref:Uncharacterized protein n=1 Tax=Candidatus Aquitaenariimonas noxiae TaxID=1974741 RepID=A0A2J0KQR9_9BACT|nr:MAG: hypothetical protein COS99_07805 [Candidatus Omnitrophica bacterium CG07_land_8_20_14_0_80_42_15]